MSQLWVRAEAFNKFEVLRGHSAARRATRRTIARPDDTPATIAVIRPRYWQSSRYGTIASSYLADLVRYTVKAKPVINSCLVSGINMTMNSAFPDDKGNAILMTLLQDCPFSPTHSALQSAKYRAA